MNSSSIITRSAMNGLLAGVIALAAGIIIFSLTGTPLATAVLYGFVIGVITFAVVWVLIFAVQRSRHPRERNVTGRNA